MMISCINHPKKEPILVLHDWQIYFSEGNKVAAGLMSIFEYWHNVKIKLQLKKPIESHHSNDLLQFHTEKQLIKQLMNITTTPANLRKAIKFLQQQGVITVCKNPNKRYGFDRTRHFFFHPDVVNEWLKTYDQNPPTITKKERATGLKSQELQESKGITPLQQQKGKQVKKVDVVEIHKAKNEELDVDSEEFDFDSEEFDVDNEEFDVDNDAFNMNPSNELIIQALLQDLSIHEEKKATKIVSTLFKKELTEVVINEWKYALEQGKVKNKFSYLAGLVNRANQGKFHPTASPEEQQAQKIVGVIRMPKDLPEPSMPHEIFPLYENWQEKQLAISEWVTKADYMNFVLPVRAYETDDMIILRCPNVYSYDFIEENMEKIETLFDVEVRMYMG